jgi:hypothetical protein
LFVPVVVLAILGVSAGQVESPPPQPAGNPAAADDVEQVFKEYFDHLYAHRFDKALAITGQLHPDHDNKKGIAIVDGMRAAALLGLKRDAEAKQLIAEAERLAPTEPFPTTTVLEGSLIADRFNFAADALDLLIARFPDVARDQRLELVSYFLRNEPKGEDQRNEDRRVALARIGYGGQSRGDWLAAGAIDILLKRGDIAGASDHLRYVDDPQLIENMLVQKRYSALWPDVEEQAGLHLSKVRASSVASAEQDYRQSPDDHEKLQLYIDALRGAGRLEDAIALRSKLPATPEEMARADEQMGWAVNNLAFVLHEAGKGDEADQMMAMLNEAPIKNAGWRVSMFINRLEMLVTAGRFQKAATLLDQTELSAKNDGNDYARQLVRRLRYCTLSSIGRKDEAAKLLRDLLDHAKDAGEASVSGLLCAGQIDKAEQLALDMLNGGKLSEREKNHFEEQFVRALQPMPLTTDRPSVWDNAWRTLRQRPAIAAAYARLGRDMPADYLPPKAR